MSIERHETYKTFAGFKYHLNVPDEWILNELPHTGRECWNCVGREGACDGFAMWRGIVLGYCANCSLDYDGERGKGFMGFGVECSWNSFESAFDLYLGPIDFDTYGDLADNEEDTIENREASLKEEQEHYDNDSTDEEEEESESEQEYYPDDEDDFGECLHIGCGKASGPYSAYCVKHFRMYDK